MGRWDNCSIIYLSIGRLLYLAYLLFVYLSYNIVFIAGNYLPVAPFFVILSVIYLGLFVVNLPNYYIKKDILVLFLLLCELTLASVIYMFFPFHDVLFIFLFPVLDFTAVKPVLGIGSWIIALLVGVSTNLRSFSKVPLPVSNHLLDIIVFFGLMCILLLIVSGFRSERARLSLLLSLLESAHEIGAKLKMDAVLNSFLKVVRTFFHCHTACVYLLNPVSDNKLVELKGIETDLKISFPNFSLKEGSGILTKSILEKKAQIVKSFRGFTDIVIPGLKNFGGGLIVPILYEEEVLGVVFIIHHIEGFFGHQDLHTLEIIANQAALAIKNTHLHEVTASLSVTDSLTHLYTHGYLREQLTLKAQEYKQNKMPFSVVMFDVDFFKKINDTLGHPKGDRTLYAIASVMKDFVSPAIGVVARYGGDEFAMALWEMQRTEAASFADKIRASISEQAFYIGKAEPVRVTISAGVAEFPADANDVSDLLDAADCALYDAKRKGRNKVSLFIPVALLPQVEEAVSTTRISERIDTNVSLPARELVSEATPLSASDKHPESPSSILKLLTQREQEILKLVATGKSNREIGEVLSISEYTVKTHVTNIQNKLTLNDRKELLMFVVKHRII